MGYIKGLKNKTKLCPFCKKEFTTHRWAQIYCSKYCRGRSRRDINPKRNALMLLRFEILKRDNFKCQYCGANPKEDGCKLRIDHIHPKSKGELNEPENLITSCENCNAGKSDVLITEHLLRKGH